MEENFWGDKLVFFRQNLRTPRHGGPPPKKDNYFSGLTFIVFIQNYSFLAVTNSSCQN